MKKARTLRIINSGLVEIWTGSERIQKIYATASDEQRCLAFATVSSTFKCVRFKHVRSKVHKNKVAQKYVLIVRSVSDRCADEVNVWGNLISIHLEPNESEPNAFKGRADSSN